MKWPWMSVDLHTRTISAMMTRHAEELAGAKAEREQYYTQLQAQFMEELAKDQDARQKEHVKEIGAREAAVEYERNRAEGFRETLGNMTLHCRDLETQLKDCTDPPITRKELEAQNKRHSFVVRKCEVLEEMNLDLDKRNKALEADLKSRRKPNKKKRAA